MEQQQKKKKLCVISSDNKHDIIGVCDDIYGTEFDIIHYCKPGGGIQILLEGINNKICGLTMEDYCIVMIGDTDFGKTQNNYELIMCIREKLRQYNSTNIILCFSLYKFGKHTMLYNARVEMFNNMLYLDVETNEYAYTFDSNCNTSEDYSLFGKNGSMNIKGIRRILDEVKDHMAYIEATFHNVPCTPTSSPDQSYADNTPKNRFRNRI